MADYSKNFLTAMTGHLNFDTGEDPKPVMPKGSSSYTAEQQLDLRDYISSLIGTGYKSGKMDDTIKGLYSGIVDIVGLEKGHKLLTQIVLHNQDPASQNKTPSDRVQQFYNTGSKDEDVNNIIRMTKLPLNQSAEQQMRNTTLSTSRVQMKTDYFGSPTIADENTIKQKDAAKAKLQQVMGQ